MPTYIYQCSKCTKRFEKFSREVTPECPECPSCGAKTRRIPAVSNFILTGNGFYQTDYGRKKDEKRDAK